MRDFGEALCVYKPPINTKTIAPVIDKHGDGSRQIVLKLHHPTPKMGYP